MIEVNLLRGFSQDAAAVNDSTFTMNTNMTGQKVVFDAKDIAIKVVLLIIPVLIVMGYEKYDEQKGKVKLNFIRNEVNKLTASLGKYGKQVQEVRRIQEEKKRLDGRINTIVDLSKDRLTNAKALNALHEVVPPEAWIEDMSINQGAVIFKGKATDDLTVSQFLRNLNESIYFEDVSLKSTKERSSSSGVVKAFEIHAKLGGM